MAPGLKIWPPDKIRKKIVKNWSKTKKIKSVRKKVQPKMGGRSRSARLPIFVSYILDYTFDFFGFGPIFNQFFWNLFRKLIQIRENGEMLVVEIICFTPRAHFRGLVKK